MQGDLHHRRRVGHRRARPRGCSPRAAGASGSPTSTPPGSPRHRRGMRRVRTTHVMDVRDRDAWVRVARRLHRRRRAARRAVQQCRHRRWADRSTETAFDEIDRIDRDQPRRRDQRRADRPCLSGADARLVPAQHRVGLGDLRLGRARDLFGDQVRGARADRSARRRMARAGDQGTRARSRLHRHAAARRHRAEHQPLDSRDGDRRGAGADQRRYSGARRRGTRSTATAC